MTLSEKKYNTDIETMVPLLETALKNKDFDVYKHIKAMLDESVLEYKNRKQLEEQADTLNFYVLNHIVEGNLPELFKKNRTAVREILTTIKEDKNLLAQFKFINAVRGYKGQVAESLDANVLVEQLHTVARVEMNGKTLKESNDKLRKVISKHNLVPTELIDESTLNFYNDCSTMLSKDLKSSTVVDVMSSMAGVARYMNEHKNDVKANVSNPVETLKEFEEKLNSTLLGSEKELVRKLSSDSVEDKRDVFESIRKRCLDSVNETLKKDPNNVDMKALREKLESKVFDSSKALSEVTKMLEVSDLLEEKE